jgi:hypothetical protein
MILLTKSNLNSIHLYINFKTLRLSSSSIHQHKNLQYGYLTDADLISSNVTGPNKPDL